MPAASSANTNPMNLTNVNYIGRLVVKYGGFCLLFIMFGRMALNAFVAYWKATHPEAPPPPTVGFGVLPALRFPTQKLDEKPSTYTLEMAHGLLDLTDRAKVFLVVRKNLNVWSDENVKKLASSYGFTNDPELIADQEYRFTKISPLNMSLEISAVDSTFSLRSNYLTRTDLLAEDKVLPEEFEAILQVKNFLNKNELIEADIATASGKVTFLKSIGGDLSQAASLSDADFLQVDINRAPIDQEHTVYSSEGEKGVISAILTGVWGGNNAVMQMDFNYRPIDYLSMETYPLRSVASAWRLVQAGEAYIASGADLDQVTVRSYEIAYYDDFEEQKYLQPIYVFKGDKDFMAFVPAVSSAYISKN